MKKKELFFQFFILLLFSQCAYYNTFFYAKHYFKKAHQETQKNITGQLSNKEKQNYQKAIEKANKLLQMYPNSKYVDDALLLLGKSHYYRSEYAKARRRLNYLLTRFPESELVPQGQLWLAKVDIGERRFKSAESSLNALIEQRPSKEIQGQAYFHLAKLYEEKEEFQKAIQAYQYAYDADIEEIKTDALFAIGSDYDSLGVHDLAAEYFLKATKSASTFEFRSEAQYRYAISMKKMGKIDEAIRIYEVLLVDERNKKNFGNYRLRIAEALTSKGDIEGAILTYRDINEEFKKKKQSAEACYALGKLFEQHKKDYEKAAEHYAKVKSEYRQSVFVDSAEKRKRDIQRMTALQQVIRMAITGEEGEGVEVPDEVEDIQYEEDIDFEDTFQQDTFMASDTAQHENQDLFKNTDNFNDIENDPWSDQEQDNQNQHRDDDDLEMAGNQQYTDRDNMEVEKAAIVENPELKSFKKEELDKNLLLLGELYLLRFSLPDSAANQYRMLINQFPESQYAPQALYNLCHVYGELNKNVLCDSCYQELLQRYPVSPYANAVREELGMPLWWTREDTVKSLFEKAEKYLFDDDDAGTAYQEYQEIVEKYPDSKLAPKAAYLLGWIAETRFDSLELAFVLYDSLAVQYPESEQAKAVSKKLQAVNTFKAQEERKQASESDSLKQEVSIKQPVMHDSLDTLEDTTRIAVQDTTADSLRIPTQSFQASLKERSLPVAEPEDGIQAIRKRITQMTSENQLFLHGLLQCEVLVDTTGSVTDIKILQNSNPDAEELLIMVIKQTKFKRNKGEDQPEPKWELLTFPLQIE